MQGQCDLLLHFFLYEHRGKSSRAAKDQYLPCSRGLAHIYEGESVGLHPDAPDRTVTLHKFCRQSTFKLRI